VRDDGAGSAGSCAGVAARFSLRSYLPNPSPATCLLAASLAQVENP
jgi:hypothetical protein